MNQKRRILFVCTVNRMRSATAERIYQKDERLIVSSAGTDRTADTILTDELLEWADTIVVMEKQHSKFIREHFPNIYEKRKIVCLYIPDEFHFMQPELIELLQMKFEDVYRRGLV